MNGDFSCLVFYGTFSPSFRFRVIWVVKIWQLTELTGHHEFEKEKRAMGNVSYSGLDFCVFW